MCSSAGVKMAREEAASDSVTEIQLPRLREPEHFLLKVESFSKSNLEKYESDEFEAAGYKWRLILYPNGDKARNGSNHISLYLSISDTQNLRSGWEVEADFSLFVYNSLSQKYLTYKLADKTRFNWLNWESGFAQLIPLDEFKEASNGYLFGDACVFGAEVYVNGSSVIAKRQTLSMMKDTIVASIFFSRSSCKMKVIAAYLLSVMCGNSSPSADNLKDILSSVGVEIGGKKIDLLLSEVSGKNITQLIATAMEKLASVPSGGGAGVVVAAAAATAPSPAPPTAAESEKEETEEEEEDDDDSMGVRTLFK